MEIRPILSSLRRNPVAATLIAAQVALTLAILANVLFIVTERIRMMGVDSGIDEAHTFSMSNQFVGNGRDPVQATDQDLAAIRAMPGVVGVNAGFSLPLARSGWQTSVALAAGEQIDGPERAAAIYFVDEQLLEAFGTRLVEGRTFTAEEVMPHKRGDPMAPPVVVLGKPLAERLFPGESAVGRMINITGDRGEPAQRVIGVVEAVATPWPRSVNPDRVIFAPYKPAGFGGYLVRTAPGERERVMQSIEETLFKVDPNRIINGVRAFEDTRRDTFRSDMAMAVLLGAIGIALLAVTAFGIVGQASFWVTQRTRQIGTRRALGARKADILRHFQTENALIVAIGIVIGTVLALGVNAWLVQALGFERLPWTWLPVGAVLVLLLGQLAVLGPALRASRIPPAIATRAA